MRIAKACEWSTKTITTTTKLYGFNGYIFSTFYLSIFSFWFLFLDFYFCLAAKLAFSYEKRKSSHVIITFCFDFEDHTIFSRQNSKEWKYVETQKKKNKKLPENPFFDCLFSIYGLLFLLLLFSFLIIVVIVVRDDLLTIALSSFMNAFCDQCPFDANIILYSPQNHLQFSLSFLFSCLLICNVNDNDINFVIIFIRIISWHFGLLRMCKANQSTGNDNKCCYVRQLLMVGL